MYVVLRRLSTMGRQVIWWISHSHYHPQASGFLEGCKNSLFLNQLKTISDSVESFTSYYATYLHKAVWSLHVAVSRKRSSPFGRVWGNDQAKQSKGFYTNLESPRFCRTISGHEAPFFLLTATSGQSSWHALQMTAWPKGNLRNSNLHYGLATWFLLLDEHDSRS